MLNKEDKKRKSTNLGGRERKKECKIAFGSKTLDYTNGTNCIHCGSLVKHKKKVSIAEKHLASCHKYQR